MLAIQCCTQSAASSRPANASVHTCLLVCSAAGGDEAQGLAAAIAEVSCEGGASAEAFARALSQSIQRDPTTGCDVLVTASSYAFATCGPTGAFAESGSTVTRVSDRPCVVFVVSKQAARCRCNGTVTVRSAHVHAEWLVPQQDTCLIWSNLQTGQHDALAQRLCTMHRQCSAARRVDC
jgi:hypothetical protein